MTDLIDDALKEVGSLPDYFVVRGEHRYARAQAPLVDPGSGTILTTMSMATTSDIDDAVAVAKAALSTWRVVPPKERGKLLWHLGDVISEARDRLGLVESLDTGKPHQDALASVDRTADYFRYYGGMVDKLEGASIPLGL